ncbi:hypothetical protein MGN70_008298 [Eutypa lata]|nr:hypothetical protein MGN70_008298 [Eutypa lata]
MSESTPNPQTEPVSTTAPENQAQVQANVNMDPNLQSQGTSLPPAPATTSTPTPVLGLPLGTNPAANPATDPAPTPTSEPGSAKRPATSDLTASERKKQALNPPVFSQPAPTTNIASAAGGGGGGGGGAAAAAAPMPSTPTRAAPSSPSLFSNDPFTTFPSSISGYVPFGSHPAPGPGFQFGSAGSISGQGSGSVPASHTPAQAAASSMPPPSLPLSHHRTEPGTGSASSHQAPNPNVDPAVGSSAAPAPAPVSAPPVTPDAHAVASQKAQAIFNAINAQREEVNRLKDVVCGRTDAVNGFMSRIQRHNTSINTLGGCLNEDQRVRDASDKVVLNYNNLLTQAVIDESEAIRDLTADKVELTRAQAEFNRLKSDFLAAFDHV